MSFLDIPKIEKSDFYIDVAIKRSKKRAQEVKKGIRDYTLKTKKSSSVKIDTICQTLQEQLRSIHNHFPSIDQFTPFYLQLTKSSLDIGELKKSLGALIWGCEKITHFQSMYVKKISGARTTEDCKKHVGAAIGRISSVFKQLSESLAILDHARKVFRAFPSIKSQLFTICIVGMPNVGKTTLFAKITNSVPEIANYEFTTKTLNVGYITQGLEKIQLIDTPGVLFRKERKNAIETQAFLAIKYHCDACIIVSHGREDQSQEFIDFLKKEKKHIIYYTRDDSIEKLKKQLFLLKNDTLRST
ncbi:MAG: GTPase [Candidatus Woesearchaeota archaeon]